MNFLRRLALPKKKIDDSSRLDVVEIVRVPDMLPTFFFLPGRAKDLSAPGKNQLVSQGTASDHVIILNFASFQITLRFLRETDSVLK